jgi:hypothetical protein
MTKGLLVYTGLLTLFTIYTIHKYEDAIKQYKDSISDYQRALNYAKNTPNAQHYTWLQLENTRLNEDNNALQIQIKSLKQDLAGEQRIQYESSTYKNSQWESNLEYTDTERIIEL